jgi:hypothetical protein
VARYVHRRSCFYPYGWCAADAELNHRESSEPVILNDTSA